ncbi:MAG TPA: hypothetical protein DF613_13900 [Lachnospiraceae bacterium]|nr:hypothetical protein [Lachnospiraceae bacterium]
MNFFSVQSINSYTKNMEMQLKWQQKKKNNDFSADGSTKLTALDRQAEEIRKAAADGSTKLMSQIRLKLNSGKKLTNEEMDYLQKHDPQTYQHVKSMEAEQESYKRELKKCKTKEEVQRVRMSHTAQSLSAVNNIKNNPAIPESKKLGLIMQELQKHEALQEVTREFVESGKYGKLPTEAERQKAEKDLEEAKRAELGIEDPIEKAEKEALEGESEQENAPAEIDGENVSEDSAKKVSEAASDRERIWEESGRTLVARQEMDRIKAELTPEARKVRRARAEAAYGAGEPKIRTGTTLNIAVK